MVLPLLAASGATLAAVFIKSVLKAWGRYSRLHKVDIANLNDIEFVAPMQYPKATTSYSTATANNMKIMQYLHEYQGGFFARVDKPESLLIFNLDNLKSSEITAQLIKSRHRKLMFLNHPDRSGSPLLASKINEAKDILLQYYSHQ